MLDKDGFPNWRPLCDCKHNYETIWSPTCSGQISTIEELKAMYYRSNQQHIVFKIMSGSWFADVINFKLEKLGIKLSTVFGLAFAVRSLK